MIAAIVDLTNLLERRLLADGRYIEIGTELMGQVTDELQQLPDGKPILQEWAKNMLIYLAITFQTKKALKNRTRRTRRS